ncbi:uncharacterized protein LOC102803256, partial [Saccoglossus kowalevskii]|uniref:ATP-dependent DNA helicase n=1 Tax=Saccoglossus kowalevskii TaxID=10224 RepID=A0ABM0M7B7_SACKO
MPAEAVVNNLDLKTIPNELKCLNDLEEHLVALHIPFLKMLALPRGGQKGVHGPVVCVPSSVVEATSFLPRIESEDQTIRVKLKRKLTYKGHYQFKCVKKRHVKNALVYLQKNNKWYKDIKFNVDWENTLSRNEDNENSSDEEHSETSDTENEPDDVHGMSSQKCQLLFVKGNGIALGEKVTSKVLTNRDKLIEIIKNDEGYKFMTPIRGTPPYWQATQKDIFAMIRQLGIPTWFCSFSSADLRWKEIVETILHEQGDYSTSANDLDWSQKCEILRQNPVTAARMFDHRFHYFLTHVIMSSARPIGHIKDYFYRVEFQQRGSPHTHCLFWVENAPIVDNDADDKVIDFVDKYVTCNMPSLEEDSELHEIVNKVQKHSTRHSKSCKKKGTNCRFNFPRPPCTRSFICRSDNGTDELQLKNVLEGDSDVTDDEDSDMGIHKLSMTKESAKKILGNVWKALSDNQKEYKSVDSLFLDIGITQEIFEKANRLLTKKTSVVLKRQPNDVWVNQYNADLLRCWDVYKREMGLLLDHAQKEATKEGNVDAKKALKQLGNVYLQNREVSAQEAVYRVCNLKLKQASRKVQFIPTGDNPVKMSLPFEVIRKQNECAIVDEDDIWMTSIVDRYKARPDGQEFDMLCLAAFCSEYRVLSTSEMSNVNNEKRKNPAVTLKNNLGHMQKRSRSEPAVKSSLFEKEADAIDTASKLLDECGQLEDAWANICPETESERIECLEEAQKNTNDNEYDTSIPDLEEQPQISDSHVVVPSCSMSKIEGHSMLRKLNVKQSEIFYKIRQWCLDINNGLNPDPFFVFVTGGAGTGKSHLIKSVYYEATRILARSLPNPDDLSVLLTAPTGVAAFNIGGMTVHSALSIPVNAKLPYVPLGNDKINSVRCKLNTLQILVIDEISMVDHKLLAYIHGRLRQIKQTSSHSPFGNVCVMACGDFYQLPPVKGSSLCLGNEVVNLWNDNFMIAELTEIMRQKDVAFAETLNRLRIHKKGEALSSIDVDMLEGRETGEESDAIHIFGTNAQVNACNVMMLHKLCTDPVYIEAQDYTKNAKTGKLERNQNPHKKVYMNLLPESITLATGARVQLTKNIDVSDGLVNGVFGTVSHITMIPGNNFPSAIYVIFDNAKVGEKLRKTSAISSALPENSTIIKVNEDTVAPNGGIRRQFPLKLAWACTVHKVQGLTVSRAVVNLKKIFTSGQAYVALSRVTTLSGLIVQEFKQSAIYCNEKVQAALENMPKFITDSFEQSSTNYMCTFIMHNIQGLQSHIQDIQNDNTFLVSDIICLTETWLTDREPDFDIQLNGFSFNHKPRRLSYNITTDNTAKLLDQCHGGVAVYAKRNKSFKILNLPISNMECLVFCLTDLNLTAAVIYRPASYQIEIFRESLLVLLEELDKQQGGTIIMGDFNQNILVSSSIMKLMQDTVLRSV